MADRGVMNDTLMRVHTNPRTLGTARERIALVTEAARRAGSYTANSAHRPVYPAPEAVEALTAFDRPLPETGSPAREVLAELDAFGSPATVVSNGGRYFGFVNGGTDPAAQAAAILAGAWDQNAATPVMSPVADRLQAVTGQWILDALALPPHARVAFTTGASEANLTAFLAARDALYARHGWDASLHGLAGAPALRVVVGEQAHASALRALRLAGFGAAQIERVPVDAQGAIDADAFPEVDSATLVVLQAGNVNSGASDPFARIIPAAREAGAWVHVDGAFGLWAAASPSRAHLVEGVQLADSWATDAHKWLNAPYDSGILAVRDAEALEQAMAMDSGYLPAGLGGAAMGAGIRMSQSARAVPVWAMLASHGREGLAELVDRTCALAARMQSRLVEAGAIALNDVVLNQALVAFPGADGTPDDAVTDAVITRFQADGIGWAGGTTWCGGRAMRLSVSDSATTEDDVDAVSAAIVAAWEAVR